ncbi:MAG TPA: hypothetical protein PLQ67_07195, partial [Burkholderiaceae bacterium]|nr:hypothetical protein [Burkholderiaceae bacterium]
GRAHARDEADRRKTWAADELAQAQQRLDAATQQLKAAQAAAWPTIDQALQAWAPWQTLSTQAQETQAQVGQSVALVMLASNLENALQSAAAQTQMQRIGVNQAQVMAAQNLAAQQRIDAASLEATWRSVHQDVEQAIAALHSHEQTAADDRVAAENAHTHFVAQQAAALSQAHIAQHLNADAQALHEAANSFALAQHQDTLTQTAQRLADAKLHREMADLRMDWAEARTNAKKQARDIKNASGPREAAEKEWIEAQQAHTQAQAQLASAQRLSAPLRSAAQAARIDALAAMHGAERSAGHANAAAVWADAWQTRDQGSSTGLRIAELSVVEGMRTLAALQSTLALTQPNDATATRIGEQAAFMQSWANDYAHALTQRHSAQESTRSTRRQLDESRIQADATERFHAFLAGRAEQLDQATQQLQDTVMAELDRQRASAAEHARADAHQALQAHQHWAHEEGRIGLEWIGNKLKPFTPDDFLDEADIAFNQRSADNTPAPSDPQTPLALAQTLAQQANDQRAQYIQTNPQAVLDAWIETELAQRKDSTRKQLHLLDDLESWKTQHPQLSTLRQTAERSAQQALASSQRVVDIGQDLQAHTLLALTQTQQRAQAQQLLATTGQHSAQLSVRLATHAQTLAEQLTAEHAANNSLQSALEHFMEASTHQTERLRAAAHTAEPNDASVLLAQADGLARLARRHEPLAHNTRVIRDALALAAAEAQTQAQADAAQASARQDRAQSLRAHLADISA